jgi:hypothetical protein
MASGETLPFPHPRDLPTRAEVLLHKNIIGGLEIDLDHIKKEISRLQTRLQHLQQKKTNHASYISPLRRLPPEILSKIVYMCLYDGIKLTTLTRICGTLREVVVGMSNLWNEILLSSIPRPRYYLPSKPWVRRYFYIPVDTQGLIGTPLLQHSRATGVVPHASRLQTITHSCRISARIPLTQSPFFQ